MSIITCCFSLLDSLKHLSGVPAVTMPLLTAFRKACFIFRFSLLRNLSSFLVNTVISNLWYYSKYEESKQKKKKKCLLYSQWPLKIATSKGKPPYLWSWKENTCAPNPAFPFSIAGGPCCITLWSCDQALIPGLRMRAECDVDHLQAWPTIPPVTLLG